MVRLFPDYLEMEEAYYARTKVWPIMHIIAMRRAIVDEHPWAARNLYNAFLESKRTIHRAHCSTRRSRAIRVAVARRPTRGGCATCFGGDPFRYGIEENRPTWEQMALYTHQQGIAHRRMKPEEFFPRGIMTKVVI